MVDTTRLQARPPQFRDRPRGVRSATGDLIEAVGGAINEGLAEVRTEEITEKLERSDKISQQELISKSRELATLPSEQEVADQFDLPADKLPSDPMLRGVLTRLAQSERAVAQGKITTAEQSIRNDAIIKEFLARFPARGGDILRVAQSRGAPFDPSVQTQVLAETVESQREALAQRRDEIFSTLTSINPVLGNMFAVGGVAQAQAVALGLRQSERIGTVLEQQQTLDIQQTLGKINKPDFMRMARGQMSSVAENLANSRWITTAATMFGIDQGAALADPALVAEAARNNPQILSQIRTQLLNEANGLIREEMRELQDRYPFVEVAAHERDALVEPVMEFVNNWVDILDLPNYLANVEALTSLQEERFLQGNIPAPVRVAVEYQGILGDSFSGLLTNILNSKDLAKAFSLAITGQPNTAGMTPGVSRTPTGTLGFATGSRNGLSPSEVVIRQAASRGEALDEGTAQAVVANSIDTATNYFLDTTKDKQNRYQLGVNALWLSGFEMSTLIEEGFLPSQALIDKTISLGALDEFANAADTVEPSALTEVGAVVFDALDRENRNVFLVDIPTIWNQELQQQVPSGVTPTGIGGGFGAGAVAQSVLTKTTTPNLTYANFIEMEHAGNGRVEFTIRDDLDSATPQQLRQVDSFTSRLNSELAPRLTNMIRTATHLQPEAANRRNYGRTFNDYAVQAGELVR